MKPLEHLGQAFLYLVGAAIAFSSLLPVHVEQELWPLSRHHISTGWNVIGGIVAFFLLLGALLEIGAAIKNAWEK